MKVYPDFSRGASAGYCSPSILLLLTVSDCKDPPRIMTRQVKSSFQAHMGSSVKSQEGGRGGKGTCSFYRANIVLHAGAYAPGPAARRVSPMIPDLASFFATSAALREIVLPACFFCCLSRFDHHPGARIAVRGRLDPGYGGPVSRRGTPVP